MTSDDPTLTGPDGFTRLADSRVAEALRVIQRTANKQGNVTMLRLAENIANDAALVRLAQEEALRTAARSFVTEMGAAWGGDAQWLTTGNRVAEVVACVLREMADDLAASSSDNSTPPGKTTGGDDRG